MTDFQNKAHRHFNKQAEDKMSEKTTITITGEDVQRMKDNLDNITKPKRVEDLLSLHGDGESTKRINAKWKAMREEVDSRASMDEADISGELTIKIKHKAIGSTGKKEIEVIAAEKMPADRVNKQTLYEDREGHLSTVKPSKQMDMFPGESRPARGV